MAKYDDSSITGYKGADRVRARPSSVIGSGNIDGAKHCFIEIAGNSLDEKSAGFSGEFNELWIYYFKDNSVAIRDFGRGVPMGWNDKENHWNWHLIYDELYMGGKMSKYQKELAKLTDADWANFKSSDYPYLFAVGLNGIGGAATQYTSEFFEVKSYRDGVCTSKRFEHGIPIINGKPLNLFTTILTVDQLKKLPVEQEKTSEPNGTYVHWKPDSIVFSGENDITDTFIRDFCKTISATANITCKFFNEKTGQTEVFESKTIRQYMEESIPEVQGIIATDTFMHTMLSQSMYEGDDQIMSPIAVCELEVVIGFRKDIPSYLARKCFHNSVATKTGCQYEAVKSAVGNFVRSQCGANKIIDADFESDIAIYVATKANITDNKSQTKDGINDLYIKSFIQQTIDTLLKVEHAKGNQDLKNLVSLALKRSQARAMVAEAQQLNTAIKKIAKVKAPEKFIPCQNYLDKISQESEIWITEGDSAGGAVKNARNRITQAIFQIRGKGLNPLKATLQRILDNKEIQGLFSVLGCGMDLGNAKMANNFDISKLRFEKIVIATDADEDGYQIRVLVFVTLYKLAPRLITEGHVYVAETPRFMINLKDGTRVFAKNDVERDELKKQYSGKIASISRFKGLGEVPADILEETTVQGAGRNLVPIDCDMNNMDNHRFINALFGKDEGGERKAILSQLLGVASEMLEDNFGEVLEDDEEAENADVEDGVDEEAV